MPNFPKDESEPLVQPPAEPPESAHLTVAKYEDTDRAQAPDWYDDTTNVGDDQ